MEPKFADLIEKRRRVEAILERPGSEGERQAALKAHKTIQSKIERIRRQREMVIRKYEFVEFYVK